MGQLTQTTAQVQVILDDADAANVGKTSLTDSTDTTAVAVRKSGFYSLSASSSNAPSTDRAILISAVRDTTATGEIRYGQVAITESNGMWWNRDDGGTLGTWYEAVSTAGTQTLTNKTLTSPVLTTPQINDTSANHQYVFAVSELVADRTVTLPLLTGNDTFVFEAHTQTLTNKTLTSPVFNTGVSGSAVLDDDTFLTASSTTLATSESIKAYVDATVTGEDLDFAGDSGTGAVDLDSQTFTIAGTANEIETAASSQTLTIGLPDSVTITTALSVDTVNEKTAAAGVTVDSLLIKDGGITAAGTSTFAGQTISDLGTVTTANIDGGSIDGTTIGASTAAAITGTTITATTGIDVTGTAVIETGSGNTYPAASTSADNLVISDKTASTPVGITIFSDNASQGNIFFGDENDADNGRIVYDHNGNANTMSFYANGAERLAIDSSGIDVTGTVTADGLTVQSTATTRPTIGNSDVNTSGLTTGLNFEPISNISNGAKINVISGLQPTVASAYTAGFEFVTEDHAGGGSFAQTKALTIGASGDISFYEDTGNTAKFFWDASAENLTITGQGNQLLLARSSVDTVQFGTGTVSPITGLFIQNATDSNIMMKIDDSAPTDSFVLNSSGNVGIGTSSPNKPLTVAEAQTANTAMEVLRLTGSGAYDSSGSSNAGAALSFGQYSGTYPSWNLAQIDGIRTGSSWGGSLVFRVNNDSAQDNSSEAMRIDSSGNLLVGKTATANLGSDTTAGHTLYNIGIARHVASGSPSLQLTRTSSDGDIAVFTKDGTTVGSIGSANKSSVSRLMIGTGETNLYFFDTDNTIYPVNANGTDSDADTDLGALGARFKDLYLSGNINASSIISSGGRNALALQADSSGIGRMEANGQVTVADDATLTLTDTECGAVIIHVYDNSTGKGAIFFATYSGSTTIIASSGDFATSDSDGNFCVYKSTSSHTVTFKNRVGGSANMSFMIVGAQAAKS